MGSLGRRQNLFDAAQWRNNAVGSGLFSSQTAATIAQRFKRWGQQEIKRCQSRQGRKGHCLFSNRLAAWKLPLLEAYFLLFGSTLR